MNKVLKNLIAAEAKAAQLFLELENRKIIVAGKTEKEVNTAVFKLADELFGIKKYWHKRIVRAGANTLHPYDENPPDLVIKEDDIVFLDFGPILEEWEADYGRTYVLGTDPLKIKLQQDIETAWQECRDYFFSQTKLTGAQFYNYCVAKATDFGWEYGGPIAGHLIGHFPHENLESENKLNYIHPENDKNLFEPDGNGHKREWILEIHFIDQQKKIGGFFEQLLV